MNRAKQLFSLLKETFSEWNEDGAPRLAAALAYYTAFSIAPLLLIVLAIVGLFADSTAVRVQIIDTIETSISHDAAGVVNDLLINAAKPATSIISTIIGVGALLLGALGVFGNLQAALDIIWNIDPKKQPSGVKGFIRDKFLSFGMLLVIGFLLLVSLVIGTVVAAMNSWLLARWPGLGILLQVLSIGGTFLVTTILFALIYKILPHVEMKWSDVWIGAAFTALLFTIGRTLLGAYLGDSATASAYGVAGAFVVILLWVNYSAQILLFGAEFTQVYARRHGSKPQPEPGTQPLEKDPLRA